jgi:hypothetical protein
MDYFSPEANLLFGISSKKRINIGPGSMIWTVVLDTPAGKSDITYEIALGAPSKSIAWQQAQNYFKRSATVLALIAGNHVVHTG